MGLRDNWWCALSPSPETSRAMTIYQPYQPGMYARIGARARRRTAGLYADPAVVPTAAFLTAEEQARAAREWEALDTIEAAPDFFGREAQAWAATHPTDAAWRKRCTAWCGRHVSAAPPTGVATCHARRSRCSTSASRAASGRRRRRYWFR